MSVALKSQRRAQSGPRHARFSSLDVPPRLSWKYGLLDHFSSNGLDYWSDSFRTAFLLARVWASPWQRSASQP